MSTTLARAEQRLREQRKWMSDHGDTRTAYRQRYGVYGEYDANGEPTWYGDGGDAIYEADRAALDAAKFAVIEAKARVRA